MSRSPTIEGREVIAAVKGLRTSILTIGPASVYRGTTTVK